MIREILIQKRTLGQVNTIYRARMTERVVINNRLASQTPARPTGAILSVETRMSVEEMALEMERLTVKWLAYPKFNSSVPAISVKNDKQPANDSKQFINTISIKRTIFFILTAIMILTTGYVTYSAWVTNNQLKVQIQNQEK